MGIAADSSLGAPRVTVRSRTHTRFYVAFSVFMAGIVVVLQPTFLRGTPAALFEAAIVPGYTRPTATGGRSRRTASVFSSSRAPAKARRDKPLTVVVNWKARRGAALMLSAGETSSDP